MYRITYQDTGHTVELLRMDAEDVFGQHIFQTILDGTHPRITAVAV